MPRTDYTSVRMIATLALDLIAARPTFHQSFAICAAQVAFKMSRDPRFWRAKTESYVLRIMEDIQAGRMERIECSSAVKKYALGMLK